MDDIDLVERLLVSDEPSIRWKVRVQVLGEDRASPKIQALERTIRRSPRVRTLLAGPMGSFRDGLRDPYSKWQGAHWVLASLADIGYPRGSRALLRLRDRLLDRWLGDVYYREFDATTKSGAYRKQGVPRVRGRYRRCASQQGNALYFLEKLGIANERADVLAERLLHWQWPDGGWNCDRDPGAHVSSFNETWLPLRGLAAYARGRRRPALKAAIERAAEVFLARKLFKRIRDGRVMTPDFVALHYPHYHHYDILGGLRNMAEIGLIRDHRCAK